MNAPSTIRQSGPVYHAELVQGSDEWLAARCGLLCASEMRLVITEATMKAANNEKTRAHISELAAQRITKYVEPHYVSDAMLRGHIDEVEATALYSEKYEPVEPVGFITNSSFGFTLGYSPDGKIAGKSAGIENKSRGQRFQVDTICNVEMPPEFAVQIQTGLLVSAWEWIDFNSFSGGLPMITLRIWPDDVMREAILNAAGETERKIVERVARYNEVLSSDVRLIPTERKTEQEMFMS